MKKWYSLLAGVVLAISLSLAVAACGGGGSDTSSSAPSESSTAAEGKTTAEAPAKDEYTVGFSVPTGAQAEFQVLIKALESYAGELGIKIVPIDAQLNVQKQVSDVNQMVAQHMDGIIVFPLAPGTLDPALKAANEAGIKVLGFNAVTEKPAPTADLTPYDANLDPGNGYMGAELLSKFVGEELGDSSGDVLGVGLGAPVPAIKFLMQQYEHFIQKFSPGSTWLETVDNPSDDIAGAEQVVSQAITKHQGEIDAVMAYSDSTAVGASTAFKNAGLEMPIVVGMNGDEIGVKAIESGQMSAMIDLLPWREGLMLAEMMHDLLSGKEIPNWIEVPVEMYTKETIGERRDWDQAVEEIEAGKLTCENGGCPPQITSP